MINFNTWILQKIEQISLMNVEVVGIFDYK